ncbi:MAG: hypothetical protein VB049_00940 [Candidatus Pelethousia sp.]|nr:hypothetical protein [Candidatus Pelethousia sp.]
MLQERNENRSTKGSDLLIVAVLVLLVIAARIAMNAAALYAWGGAVQISLFILLIAVCFLLYKTRLCSYRYTLYYKEPSKEELDEYGGQAELPFPVGTLVAERMMGSKAKSAEVILPGEMVDLIGPDGSAAAFLPRGKDGEFAKVHNAVLTTRSTKKAHALIFGQHGNYYRLYFNPSPEMARLLGEIIAAVREA